MAGRCLLVHVHHHAVSLRRRLRKDDQSLPILQNLVKVAVQFSHPEKTSTNEVNTLVRPQPQK